MQFNNNKDADQSFGTSKEYWMVKQNYENKGKTKWFLKSWIEVSFMMM